MDYKEALEKVQSHTLKQNFMVVTLGYGNKVILPYKDGLAFMGALVNAEQLHEPYSEQHRISEIDRSNITSTVMSHDEYIRFKIAALLGVAPSEVSPKMLAP